MSKKYTPESFVLAYRLWTRPSDGLPLDELDDVLDHDLTDRLVAYGRETLTKQFGSIDAWYEHRAKDRIAHLESRNSRASRGHVFGGPGPKLARVPELAEALADEKSDERPFLEQLLEETDVITERTGGTGGYFVLHQVPPRFTRRYFVMHYVMRFDSESTAREVARYLTGKRVKLSERQSPDTWTRFGAIRVADLDANGRIRMAEDLRKADTIGLVERVMEAVEVLRDAGVVDVAEELEHSDTDSIDASATAVQPFADVPAVRAAVDSVDYVSSTDHSRDQRLAHLRSRGLAKGQLNLVESALASIEAIDGDEVLARDLYEAGAPPQTVKDRLLGIEGAVRSGTGNAMRLSKAHVLRFLVEGWKPRDREKKSIRSRARKRT